MQHHSDGRRRIGVDGAEVAASAEGAVLADEIGVAGGDGGHRRIGGQQLQHSHIGCCLRPRVGHRQGVGDVFASGHRYGRATLGDGQVSRRAKELLDGGGDGGRVVEAVGVRRAGGHRHQVGEQGAAGHIVGGDSDEVGGRSIGGKRADGAGDDAAARERAAVAGAGESDVAIQRIRNHHVLGVGGPSVVDHDLVDETLGRADRVIEVHLTHRHIGAGADGGGDEVRIVGRVFVGRVGEGRGRVGQHRAVGHVRADRADDGDGDHLVDGHIAHLADSAATGREAAVAAAACNGRAAEGDARRQRILDVHGLSHRRAAVSDHDGVGDGLTRRDRDGASLGQIQVNQADDGRVGIVGVVRGVAIGRVRANGGGVLQARARLYVIGDGDYNGVAHTGAVGQAGQGASDHAAARISTGAVGAGEGDAHWQGVGDADGLGIRRAVVVHCHGVGDVFASVDGGRRRLDQRQVRACGQRRGDGVANSRAGQRSAGDYGGVHQAAASTGRHRAIDGDVCITTGHDGPQVAGQRRTAALAAGHQRQGEIARQGIGDGDVVGVRRAGVGDQDGVGQVFARRARIRIGHLADLQNGLLGHVDRLAVGVVVGSVVERRAADGGGVGVGIGANVRWDVHHQGDGDDLADSHRVQVARHTAVAGRAVAGGGRNEVELAWEGVHHLYRAGHSRPVVGNDQGVGEAPAAGHRAGGRD